MDNKPVNGSTLSESRTRLSTDVENVTEIERVSFNDIRNAENTLAESIVYTPCEKCEMSDWFHMDLYLKMDFLQKTGSYKDRGARFFLLSLDKTKIRNGVVSASLGNHAIALAYHGQKLGIPIHVVVPTVTHIAKIAQCIKFNAKITVQGKTFDESDVIARHMAKTNDWIYCNGHDDTKIIAANGTIGMEILSQVLTVDAIVVPVTDGALLAGVALAVKTQNPKILIIGVEAEDCIQFSKQLISDKKGWTSGTGINAFTTGQFFIDRMIVVSDAWTSLALLRLLEQEKCLVERISTLPLAAVLSGQLKFLKEKRVVLVLPSANINSSSVGDVLEKGLIADGRLIEFVVRAEDGSNTITDLSQLLSNAGVSVKKMSQEKCVNDEGGFGLNISCVCETRDKEQAFELQAALQAHFGEAMRFPKSRILL